MSRFRVSDLEPISPDAAELIDSAQDAAKKLARCCAAKDAEIARLREAICEFAAWENALSSDAESRQLSHEDEWKAYYNVKERLLEIAREGR